MIKELRHIMSMVLIAMAIVSCNRDVATMETLSHAEAIMQEHPDSALSLLQAIDTEAIATDRCRALHALLLSQAYDKNYIDLTSDSLISIAINYYADTDDHRHAMLAHYYRGRIYENDGDIASCIIQCLDAEKRTLLINDYFYLGMIYGTIADCYNKAYNFDEERNYALRSLESFKKTSNELYIKYAYLSYGVSLVNCKKYSDAEKFYEELLKVDKYKQDNIFYRKIISNFIHLKWINKDYQAIRKILYSIKNEYECDATTFAIIADLYRNENKIDSAQSYLSNAKMLIKTDREKAITKHVEYDIMCDNQNYAQARKQLSDLNKIQNDAIRIIWEQSVIKNQRDYFRQKTELAEYKNREQKLIHISAYIIIGILVLCIAFFIVYRYKKEKRINKLKLNQILQELSYKETQIAKTKQRISLTEKALSEEQHLNKQYCNEIEIQNQMLKLYEKQQEYEIIYRQIAERQVAKSSIVGYFKAVAHSETNTINHDDWEQLYKYVNTQYPQFVQRLSDLVKLSEIEHKVCVLVKCKMTPKEISILTNRSIESVSSIRRRLYKKIYMKQGKPSDLDNLIYSL